MGRDLTAEDRELRALLGDVHTIAVVGLSSRPGRPSFEVARYLQRHGYRIVPVNPNETEVLGEPAYASLRDLPADLPVDVVDVFRRAEHTPVVDALHHPTGVVVDEADDLVGEIFLRADLPRNRLRGRIGSDNQHPFAE